MVVNVSGVSDRAGCLYVFLLTGQAGIFCFRKIGAANKA